MENALCSAIEKQARKLIARHKRGFADHADFSRRYRKRTGLEPAEAQERLPDIWALSPHFNPAYCIKHSKYIAKTIWRKIVSREYEVSPAVLFKIPKESGGFREIMVFSIPDAAVANLFNRKIRDRNKNIQSPFCYAYRKDRSLFDAVLQTASFLNSEKNYVIQYDFAKYFDTISHDYINFIIKKGEFNISPAEQFVIGKFLKHKFALVKDYGAKKFENRREGVPQGCSLSLFLSNMAGHELDKELEKSNGSFVRFADDVVCVTSNYNDAVIVTSAFREHCYYSGISINRDKSPGICLMTGTNPDDERDFFIDSGDIGKVKPLKEFDYLGHKFKENSIGISSRAEKRIKERIAKIIFIHLLHYPKKGSFNPGRVGAGFYDWDLATCINELRSYIYGGLRHYDLQSFMDSNTRIERFRGLMSFYPLVTDVSQFSALDGWLVSVVRRALRERRKVLASSFQIQVETISEQKIITGDWYRFDEINIETKLPSFVFAWRAAKKAYKQYGLADFKSHEYYSNLI